MPLISDDDRRYLTRLFAERLVHPVRLRFYTQRTSALTVPGQVCHTCRDTQQLLEELVALSDKLRLEVHDFYEEQQQARSEGIAEIPAVLLEGANKGKVRFIGVPAGYEFATLVEDLVDVSRGTTSLQAASRQTLAALAAPVHIKVFVTPTCPYCPSAARLAHMLAVESDKVAADVIDVTEYPHLAQRYRIYGVPKTVINDAVEFEGVRPEAALVSAAAAASATAKQG